MQYYILIFFLGNYASSTSPTSPFYNDANKLSTSGAFSPSRAHLPSFIGGFFGKDSISVNGENQASIYERILQQTRQKDEKENTDAEMAKVNGADKDEPPTKRVKECGDSNGNQKPQHEKTDNSDKEGQKINESESERKSMSSENRNDIAANAPMTIRPHVEENDVSSLSRSPLSTSSIPSPCMASLSPSLSRTDNSHLMTVKGSASIFHIPAVATAEL